MEIPELILIQQPDLIPFPDPIPQPIPQPIPEPIPESISESIPKSIPIPIPEPIPKSIPIPIPESILELESISETKSESGRSDFEVPPLLYWSTRMQSLKYLN